MSDQEVTPQEANVVDTRTEDQPAQTETAPAEGAAPAQQDPPVSDPTQVRTLQQMAVEQGAKIPKEMTPEQLRMQLLLDHHLGLSAVVPAFKKLSQRGKDRLFTALLQLPHEGIETALNGNFEKQIYLAGQKVLMAKHAILFNRAKQEAVFERQAQEQKEKAKQEAAAKTAEDQQKPVETAPESSDNVGNGDQTN